MEPEMMTNTPLSLEQQYDLNAAFSALHIRSRCVLTKAGPLWICEAPDGLSFNLSITCAKATLWSLACWDLPHDAERNQVFFCGQDGTKAGFRITDEHEMVCFREFPAGTELSSKRLVREIKALMHQLYNAKRITDAGGRQPHRPLPL